MTRSQWQPPLQARQVPPPHPHGYWGQPPAGLTWHAAPPPVAARPDSGVGLALGIVSLVMALLGFAVIPLVFGPISVVTGIVAVCKTRGGAARGVSIAGLALGTVNLAIVGVQILGALAG